MKIERTKTYTRIFIGGHYLTIIKKDKSKQKSERAACQIINLASELTSSDIHQMRDYFSALMKDNPY